MNKKAAIVATLLTIFWLAVLFGTLYGVTYTINRYGIGVFLMLLSICLLVFGTCRLAVWLWKEFYFKYNESMKK